jgi:hypothetical protein
MRYKITLYRLEPTADDQNPNPKSCAHPTSLTPVLSIEVTLVLQSNSELELNELVPFNIIKEKP